MNRGNNKYVAIKIKPSSTAIQEARMHMYLREVCNIPRFHGLLAMSDELLVGLVCELIADDGKGGHNFTLNIIISMKYLSLLRISLTIYMY